MTFFTLWRLSPIMTFSPLDGLPQNQICTYLCIWILNFFSHYLGLDILVIISKSALSLLFHTNMNFTTPLPSFLSLMRTHLPHHNEKVCSLKERGIQIYCTVTNPMSNTLIYRYVISYKHHNVRNVITKKRHNETNIITDKRHNVTNVIMWQTS